MLISVDFWKSMHGFAMDSWTRDRLSTLFRTEVSQPASSNILVSLRLPIATAICKGVSPFCTDRKQIEIKIKPRAAWQR